MTAKQSSATVVLLLVCFQVNLALGSFSITCESEFVPTGGSFCNGVPVICTVLLSTNTCSQNNSWNAIEIGKGNLSLLITDHIGDSTVSDLEFIVDQANFTLDVATSFLPSEPSTELTVRISSSNAECQFNVSTTDDVTATEDCLYPLTLDVEIGNLSSTTPLKGGNIIPLTIEINIASFEVSNLTLALGPSHPTLTVVSFVHDDDPLMEVTPYDTATYSLSLPSESDPFLVVTELSVGSTFLVNVTLQVSKFVLPKSVLYFSFCVYYQNSNYNLLSLKQCTPQIRDFVAASPLIGDWSLRLPFYDGIDRKRYTFPPNEGDIFTISVPVVLPCVSTELNISVTIPEFRNGISSYFFTSVTNVAISTPSNLLSVPQLCDSSLSECNIEGTALPVPTIKQMEALRPGFDIILVEFGALVYNLSETVAECSCHEEEITLTLTGIVAAELVCERQTLADNVTVEIKYITESTSWLESNMFELVDAVHSVLFPVNASMPAIDLQISSHTGDAGDSFNITLDILHNVEYSSFTAYDLNYTFSIEPYLDPSENITICFFNTTSDNPVLCESVLFEEYNISRLGYHEVFTLDVHRVELSLEATIIQDVAPGISFCNPLGAIFQSLPNDNTLNLTPLVCSNSSCGEVVINPVVPQQWVVHWSDVDATDTESFPHYITIDEQFNMTTLACMPESLTKIEHVTLVPSLGNFPLVTINDAFVTFIGSELYNTTLAVGDDLFASENISLNVLNTTVTFFFGSEVLIPRDTNVSLVAELCFEIGLQCTVDNVATLVDGSRITYDAYIETDFDIRASVPPFLLKIAEPTLVTVPVPPTSSFDAGDVFIMVIRIQHTSSSLNTNAFRLNLTVTYSTTYFFLNETDLESTMLLLESTTRLYSINTDNEGEIIYSADELQPGHTLEAIAYFRLTNDVKPSDVYTIPHLLEWHNLPYELVNSGREYSTTGDHTIVIEGIQLSMDYTTSNTRTPNENVQIGEYAYMNVTAVVPEGFLSLSVLINHTNIQPNDYHLNITYGEVLHIGDSLSNVSLSVGDTIDNSLNIYQSEHTDVFFIFGSAIFNKYDNTVDEGDMVVVYIEAYISRDSGSGVENQDISIDGIVLEEPLATDRVGLLLSHPQIQVTNIFVIPFGPWDGGDILDVILIIRTSNSEAFVTYDVLVMLEADKGDMPHNFMLLNTSRIVGVSGCSDDDVTFLSISSEEIMLSPFNVRCIAIVWLQVQILDDAVIASDTFTITSTIKEYYSLSPSSSELGLRYGPEEPNTFTGSFKGVQLTLTTNISSPALFVASEETLEFLSTLTIPEGHTLNVSVHHYISVLAPADPSVVDLNITLQSTEIYPFSENTELPVLGDMFNPSDNLLNINDTCVFTHTVFVPVNSSGTSFSFISKTNYTTSQTEVEVLDSITIYVIRPDINAVVTLSRRIAYIDDTITFGISISRTDDMFPDYDININLTIIYPSSNIFNISSEGFAVHTTIDGLMTALYVFSPLSYISGTDTRMFQFEGTIGSNVSDGQMLDLFSFTLDYSTEPTNGREYSETFTVPAVFILEPVIDSFDIEIVSYDPNTDVSSWRLTLSEISGPPNNLILMIELSPDMLEFVSVDINMIGSGLVYGSVIKNEDAHVTNVSISDLSLNITDNGPCMECDRDISVVFSVEFLRKITDCNNMINASVYYSLLQKTISAECTPLFNDLVTSNPDTLENTLQVSEEVLVNITIIPQEDVITNLTLIVMTNQTSQLDYPLVFGGAQVIYIGSSLKNLSLVQGNSDTSTNNINITTMNIAVFEFGKVFNVADHSLNSEDEVIVQLELYVSAVGTGVDSQDVTITYYLEHEGFVQNLILFQLVHPQIEMAIENITTGPWDSNDVIRFILSLSSAVMNATAYDLSFNVSLLNGALLNLELSSTTTIGVDCRVTNITCSVNGFQMTCPSLPQSCILLLNVSTTLPHAVVIGNNITLSVVLVEYDSSPSEPTLDEKVYMPVTASITDDTPVVSQEVILSTNFPTELEYITVITSLSLPEGITRNLSVVFEAVWNTTESLKLNLSIENIDFGHNINVSEEALLFSYPVFLFGDVLNIPDNIHSPIHDNINITFLGQIPLESFQLAFTVQATTSYWPYERVIIKNSTMATVIRRSELLYSTSVSSRLLSVGETVVYNLVLVYVPTELLPNASTAVNISLFFPSFVEVIDDNLNVYQQRIHQIVDNSTEFSYTLIELMQEKLNQTITVFKVVIPVFIEDRNGSSIRSLASIDYSFTDYISLRKFTDSISFPIVYLPQLNLNFYLYSSSDSRTEETLVTHREITVWRLELSDVIGPAINLAINVQSQYEGLYIADVKIIFVGINLTFTASPNVEISDESATVTFINLTLVNPSGVDDCQHCNLVVDVHYLLLSVVTENFVTQIQANVTYGSFEIQREVTIVLTPPTDLLLLVEGPTDDLEAGSTYPLNVTIRHNSNESLVAHNVTVGIDEPSHIKFHNDTYVETYCCSESSDINASVLLGSGLDFPLFHTNDTIQLYLTFSVNPRTRYNTTVLIKLYLVYSNSGGISGNFSGILNEVTLFQTSHLPPATTQLTATSSHYTMNNEFAINEVIKLEIRSTLPHGLVDLEYHTVIESPSETQLPVLILNTDQNVPTNFELEIRNQSMDIFLLMESELHLIWRLGSVYNNPDRVRNEDDVIVLLYTLAISLTNLSNIPLEVTTFAIAENNSVPFSGINGIIVEPELFVYKTIKILDMNTKQAIEFKTTLSHGNQSTAVAFNVLLEELIPFGLDIQQPVNISLSSQNASNPSAVESEIMESTNGTSLRVSSTVFIMDSKLTLSYIAQANSSFPYDQNVTAPVVVHFSSIIQEGIGESYSHLEGKMYTVSAFSCIVKETAPIFFEIDNLWAILLYISFGFVTGCGVTVLVLIFYYCWRAKKTNLRVVPALIATTMFKMENNESDESHFLFGKRKSRPLVSSLLIALKDPQWYTRVDTYEFREVEYVAELERDLFILEMEVTRMLISYMLEMLPLNKEKLPNLIAKCEQDISGLKSNLKVNMSDDMQDMEMKFVADKLLEEEDLKLALDMEVEEFKDYLPLDIDEADLLLEVMNKQNLKQLKQMLSSTDIRRREREEHIVQQYMLHYSLGLKVLAASALKDASSNNTKQVEILLGKLEEVSELISSMKNEMEERGLVRRKRQLLVLLEKRIIDEEDLKWKDFMLKQMSKYIKETPDVDRSNEVIKIRSNFVLKFDGLQSALKQKEVFIIQSALRKQKELELQLGTTSHTISENMTTAEMAIQSWCEQQTRREEALEQLEERVTSELKECWRMHLKKRTRLLDDQTSSFSLFLTSKGVQLHKSDEIMQQHAQSRVDLYQSLEASRLIKKAKFQALVDNQSGHFHIKKLLNGKLLSMKFEIERKFMREVVSSLSMEEIFDEYHRRVITYQTSIAMDQLTIIVKSAQRLQQQKKRKLGAIQHKYYHQMKDKMKSGSTDSEIVQEYLEKREEIILGTFSRVVDDERRRANKELSLEKERALSQNSTNSGAKEASNSNGGWLPSISSPLVKQFDQNSFNDETYKLLSSYQEDVLKIEAQLNEEQRRSASELDRKMRQRRLQRQKARIGTASLLEPVDLLPGFKHSKLRELVIRHMYAIKLETTRKNYLEELRTALEELQADYNLKRQEAITNLEKRFEMYITKVGILSEDQLVDAFKDIDQWHSGHLSMNTRHSSSEALSRPWQFQYEDPLLTNRMRRDELPPLTFVPTKQRGTIM